MVADTVDQQEFDTGERHEGIYYGMLNFGYKISQSIALLLLGFMLDIIRFDADLKSQSLLTSLSLGILLAVGSLVAFILAINAYAHYSLDESKVLYIQAELKSRGQFTKSKTANNKLER